VRRRGIAGPLLFVEDYFFGVTLAPVVFGTLMLVFTFEPL
jgi:hypothetical protein